MVVVDTNILAYLLITGDRTHDAQALYQRDADWKSEAFVLIEFTNILATYQHTGNLSRDQSESLLNEAQARMPNLIAISHLTALQTAQRFAVSAYDTRFLAVAEKLGTKLVTEDSKLRTAAPTLTQPLSDILSF